MKKQTQVASLSQGRAHDEFSGRELSDAVVFFHEAIAAHLGMSAVEWKCLGLLDQYGPASASRLAELSGFTTGAITGIVNRLQKLGYVRREPNPGDRRSVIIRPTLPGRVQERITPIFESLGRAMAAVSSHYTASQVAAVAAFLRETTEVLRSETAKLKRAKRSRMG